MRTAFDRVDIIDVGVYVLREGVVVLHGHLDRHAVLFGVDVDDRFGDGLTARGVQVFDELLEALFRIEMVADVFAVLVPLAFVQQVQVDAFVQECQLTQAVGQDVVLVFRREREDTAVGFEGDRGSAIVAGADHFDRRSRSAFAVRLAEYFAVAVDFGDEQRRECVHARNTHTVQTARNLVTALVELAARMEHGEHDFECGLALLFVEVGRDASAVILDCDRVVFVDRNVDVGTVSCQRLVDRVVHHLVNQVVQTFFSDVADIHGRTLPDSFQTFEDLDVGGGILLFLLLYLFFFSTHIDLKYIVQIYGKVS